MPHAIAFFLIEQLAFSGVILGGIAQALITAAVTIGFTVGVSALSSALFGSKKGTKPSDGQQTIRQAVGSRYRDYGIVRGGGQLAFEESANGTLVQVLTLGSEWTAEILEHLVNGKVVTVDGAGTVTDASFHGAVKIHTRPGDDDQTAIGEVTALFPEWTADHRQRGCSLAAIFAEPVKAEQFSEVYSGQQPQYMQTRKAGRCYDPRLDDTAGGAGAHRLGDPTTWSWSENWALITADYAAHPDGYGLGYDYINWANVAAEADVCDEDVVTLEGDTIKRYRLWLRYGLAVDQRSKLLSDMLAAADGFCWQDADCKLNIMAGRFEEPDLVITDDHILAMTATLGPGAQERVSAVKPVYTEASIGYMEQEGDVIPVPGAAEDPNTDPQALELFYAPHHNQAARVGKIAAWQLGDDRWHLQLQVNLFGLNLLGRRFCRVETDSLGIAAYFKIDGLKLNLAACTVEATLAQVTAEDWDFSAEADEGTPPVGSSSSGGAVVVPVPAGLAATSQIVSFDGVAGVRISATWDVPPRADLTAEAQYSATGGASWLAMAVSQDDNSAQTGAVTGGVGYEVRARFVTLAGRPSAWAGPVTIDADASDPAQAIEASEDLAANAFVNIHDVAGAARIRNADATDPAKEAHGFVPSAIASGASGAVRFGGLNADASVAANGRVWLSEGTPGGYQTAAPVTGAHIVQLLGTAVAGVGIYFAPQPTQLLEA